MANIVSSVRKPIINVLRVALVLLLAMVLSPSSPRHGNLFSLAETTYYAIPPPEGATLLSKRADEWHDDSRDPVLIGVSGLYGTNNDDLPEDYYRELLTRMGWLEYSHTMSSGGPMFCNQHFPSTSVKIYRPLPVDMDELRNSAPNYKWLYYVSVDWIQGGFECRRWDSWQ